MNAPDMRTRLSALSRFGLSLVVLVVANLLAASLAPSSRSALIIDLVYRPLLALSVLLGMVVLLKAADGVQRNPLAAMGLGVRGPWLRDIGIGLLLGAGLIVLSVGLIALVGGLTISARSARHPLLGLAMALLVLGFGALGEELAFRGYPFQRLIDAVGATAAVIVLSALFAALHLANPHASLWGFLNTALVGVLFSLAYLRTRALWMPWAIHFAWNTTLGLVFGLPVSGLSEFSVLVQARARGPVWLTGGSYGIEASATGALVISAGIAALVFLVPQRKPVQVPEENVPLELTVDV